VLWLTDVSPVSELMMTFEVVPGLTRPFGRSLIGSNLMKCATSSVRAITLVITEDSTQDITDCNASVGFIPAKDLVNAFATDGGRFARALVIVAVIELSRPLKRSLISSRASEKPS